MPRSKWWTLAIDIDACAAAETVPGSTKAFGFDVSSSGRRPGENRPFTLMVRSPESRRCFDQLFQGREGVNRHQVADDTAHGQDGVMDLEACLDEMHDHAV